MIQTLGTLRQPEDDLQRYFLDDFAPALLQSQQRFGENDLYLHHFLLEFDFVGFPLDFGEVGNAFQELFIFYSEIAHHAFFDPLLLLQLVLIRLFDFVFFLSLPQFLLIVQNEGFVLGYHILELDGHICSDDLLVVLDHQSFLLHHRNRGWLRELDQLKLFVIDKVTEQQFEQLDSSEQ